MELKRQGLAGAEPRTRRRGLKLPATAHGRAAGHGTRAGQSRNGIFERKKLNSWYALCAVGWSLTFLLASSAYSIRPSCLPLQHTLSFMLNYLYQPLPPVKLLKRQPLGAPRKNGEGWQWQGGGGGDSLHLFVFLSLSLSPFLHLCLCP